MSTFNKTKILLSLFCVFAIAAVFVVSDSRSLFSDSVRSTGNVISTGYWENEDTENLELGDVIISEIHWAGSPASNNDQWIELFNTTEKDISLKGWAIENAGKSPKSLKITGNATIEAESYLLITRRKPVSAESALAVSSDVQNGSLYLNRAEYEQLLLKDSKGNVIDGTPEESGSWPAGEYTENERYHSMQRSADTEINGTSTDSWHTCEPKDRMNTLWKDKYFEKYDICGTPRELKNSTEGQSQNAESSSDENKKTSPEGETEGLSDDKKKDGDIDNDVRIDKDDDDESIDDNTNITEDPDKNDTELKNSGENKNEDEDTDNGNGSDGDGDDERDNMDDENTDDSDSENEESEDVENENEDDKTDNGDSADDEEDNTDDENTDDLNENENGD